MISNLDPHHFFPSPSLLLALLLASQEDYYIWALPPKQILLSSVIRQSELMYHHL